jgi:hypothetical protein
METFLRLRPQHADVKVPVHLGIPAPGAPLRLTAFAMTVGQVLVPTLGLLVRQPAQQHGGHLHVAFPSQGIE